MARIAADSRGAGVLPLNEGAGRLSPARKLKELQARFPFRPRRGLSQHFLIDERVLDRIVKAVSPQPGELVLEIGAGAGFLTERLLEAQARVLAVEIDPALVRALKASIGFSPRLKIVEGDVLELDLPGLLEAEGAREVPVAANLPYHITSPALFKLFECCRAGALGRMVLMVQREVGARMTARPGGKDYSALSVGVAYRGRCERLFDVAPGAFVPVPKVWSSVMNFTPGVPSLSLAEEAPFFALVRAAFGQRRKMLVNAVAAMAGGKENAARLLKACSLDPKRRGETLSLEEFKLLAGQFPAGRITEKEGEE